MAKVNEFKQDQHNFNRGTEEGARLMNKSLKEFGAGRSILVDKDDNIIAGNKTALAALNAGIEDAIVVETTGDKLVVVKRTDIDIDSKQGRELALADNKTTEVNLAWDDVQLQQVGEEFGLDLEGWGIDLPDLVPDGEEQPKEAKEDDFDAEAADIPQRVSAGDVWLLGEHRLMCGDSTKAESYVTLLEGEKAVLCLTDPPYGVAIVSKENKVGFGEKGKNKLAECGQYKPIIGDETTETAKAFYNVVKDYSANQILFGGNYFTDFLAPKACWLVWDKEMAGNFADVELAWTSFDKGAKLYKWTWNGMIREGDKNVELKKRVHPTQKPVGMLANILEDFSKEGDTIIDSFGGSGSTLIACEQLGRKCRMMELDPHYCDVILARWEKLTGKVAVKL